MEVIDAGALMAAVRARAPDAPLDRAQAAVTVGEELASGGDELIGRFVAEARDAGCSWTEIGARMGVSKQAARQRFAPLASGYLEHVADRRLAQLGIGPLYGTANPLAFMDLQDVQQARSDGWRGRHAVQLARRRSTYVDIMPLPM